MDDVMEFDDYGDATPLGRLFNFHTGRSHVLQSHKSWLAQNIVPLLRQRSPIYIRLFGYASRLGADAFNQQLSRDRAQAVKRTIEELAGQSVDSIEVGWYGESRSQGKGNDNDPVYRAVDAYVYRTSTPPPPPLRPPDISVRIPNIYFGFGGKVGGEIFGGIQTVEAVMWSSDKYEEAGSFNLEARIKIAGPVAGATLAGAVFVLAFGAINKEDFVGVKFDGWDFAISLGGRWGDALKALRGAKGIAKLLEGLSKGVGAAKKLSPGEWKKIAEGIKKSRDALGIDSNSTKPQVNVIDVPFAAFSPVEVGIYKWWGTVTAVEDFIWSPQRGTAHR